MLWLSGGVMDGGLSLRRFFGCFVGRSLGPKLLLAFVMGWALCVWEALFVCMIVRVVSIVS